MPETSNRRVESFSGAGPFRVRTRSAGDAHVIALTGELDLATAQALDRELEHAETTDARVIALDLRELEFIDSSGLRVIVKAHRRAAGRLVVVKGPERVQRAFELCGLLGLLAFVDEIPARDHDAQATDVSALAGAATDRSAGILRVATVRRANQAALAAAVRDLRSRGRLRPIR